MQAEVGKLLSKQTWTLVNAPMGTNIVGSRWTYHLKRDAHGAIVCYKAHLVAQGFTQTQGIDYNDMFAPMAKFTSTRVVLALVAIHNWEVHQMDIKNAYLNAELTETIYMAQPPGFTQVSDTDKVCRLFKALYGLKQGGQCWYL